MKKKILNFKEAFIYLWCGWIVSFYFPLGFDFINGGERVKPFRGGINLILSGSFIFSASLLLLVLSPFWRKLIPEKISVFIRFATFIFSMLGFADYFIGGWCYVHGLDFSQSYYGNYVLIGMTFLLSSYIVLEPFIGLNKLPTSACDGKEKCNSVRGKIMMSLSVILTVFLGYSAMWLAEIWGFNFYPISGKEDSLPGITVVIVLIFAVLISFSLLAAFPFYIYLIGFRSGKQILLYILAATVAIHFLDKTGITTWLSELVDPNFMLLLYLSVHFIYFILTFFIISFVCPSSNLRYYIRTRPT